MPFALAVAIASVMALSAGTLGYRFAAAQAAADEARRRDTLERKQRELRHEVQRLAQGRPCLSSDLARSLQRATPPLPVSVCPKPPAALLQPLPPIPASGRVDALREWAGGSR